MDPKSIGKSLVAISAVLALLLSNELKAEPSTCKKTDPGATTVFEVQEKTNNVEAGEVMVAPLALGKGLLVAEAIGTLKLFDEKGSLARRLDLNSSITIQPFESEGKLFVLAGKRLVVVNAKTLEKISEVNLSEDPIAGGMIDDNTIGVGTRGGKILMYSSTGALKREMDGLLANSKFTPFFRSGNDAVVVGQNSVRFVKLKKEKKDKDYTDVLLSGLIVAAVANGDLLAVAETSGKLHLFDMNTQKTVAHNLGGSIDSILPNGKGILVSTSSGKLLFFEALLDKAPQTYEVTVAPKGLFAHERFGIFISSKEGAVYSLKNNVLSKTKYQGRTGDFFSLGNKKGHVTFQNGYLRVIDPDGSVKLEHKIDRAGDFPMTQLEGNTFMVVGNPIRSITIAENLKCPPTGATAK